MPTFPPNFRPLLAFKAEIETLKFPVMASPKIDGIRCLSNGSAAFSRTLKLIPNNSIQREFLQVPGGLDGELTVGKTFQESSSGIMSQDGNPDWTFHVFDRWNSGQSFAKRFADIKATVDYFPHPRVKVLPHQTVYNASELANFEVWCLDQGYEGVMVRNPNGLYKFGRSTSREAILGKIKRFDDQEATILGMMPLMRNGNPQEIDHLGLAKRSTSQVNKVADDLMGTLIVTNEHWKENFEIGTGFTERQRIDFWSQGELLFGKKVKFKYLPHGSVDRPRHPVFLGFRDERDF